MKKYSFEIILILLIRYHNKPNSQEFVLYVNLHYIRYLDILLYFTGIFSPTRWSILQFSRSISYQVKS